MPTAIRNRHNDASAVVPYAGFRTGVAAQAVPKCPLSMVMDAITAIPSVGQVNCKWPGSKGEGVGERGKSEGGTGKGKGRRRKGKGGRGMGKREEGRGKREEGRGKREGGTGNGGRGNGEGGKGGGGSKQEGGIKEQGVVTWCTTARHTVFV